MPLSAILSIVSVLMVIGIISLTDAIIRIFLRQKAHPKYVVLFFLHDDKLEYELSKAARKYPGAKIIINSSDLDKTNKMRLNILKRDYPNIIVKEKR